MWSRPARRKQPCRTASPGTRRPTSCAARAGSRPTICAPSAIARARCRWATRREEWAGKPVIAIINTWSDAQPCHTHFKTRVDDVKRGVLQAGGFPVELPAMSLSESFAEADDHALPQLPGDGDGGTACAAHPVDGAVLMGGCDKTTPALLMGAISIGLPVDLRAGRADAARQLARQGAGLGLRRLEILGRAARRQHHRARTGTRSKAASPAATAPA